MMTASPIKNGIVLFWTISICEYLSKELSVHFPRKSCIFLYYCFWTPLYEKHHFIINYILTNYFRI